MLVMIAGPYRSGSDDPEVWQQNLNFLNACALKVFEKGHVPIIGVNAFLPLIEVAGIERYEELMMPNCLELAKKCDAVLRVGGPSSGADLEVGVFVASGKQVYHSIDEVPATV